MVTHLQNVSLAGTVKPLRNNHPRDPKVVASIEMCSLFRGHLYYKNSKYDSKIVVVIGRQVFAICY